MYFRTEIGALRVLYTSTNGGLKRLEVKFIITLHVRIFLKAPFIGNFGNTFILSETPLT